MQFLFHPMNALYAKKELSLLNQVRGKLSNFFNFLFLTIGCVNIQFVSLSLLALLRSRSRSKTDILDVTSHFARVYPGFIEGLRVTAKMIFYTVSLR